MSSIKSTPLTNEYLEQLLEPVFKNHVVQNVNLGSEMKGGENYGSILLTLEVDIKQDNKPKKKIFMVAKIVPISPYLEEFFNSSVTFSKEIDFYALVCPLFKKLQEDHGISEMEHPDLFPRYFGSRKSLKKDITDVSDRDAVLLLEDLRPCGFQMLDRLTGLDLEHTELVIKQLAWFHCMSVALRIKQPDAFKNIILPCCRQFTPKLFENFNKQMIEGLLSNIKSIPECEKYADKINDLVKLHASHSDENITYSQNYEEYFTLCHCDMWTNNMLFSDKILDNGSSEKGLQVKFVDFQLTRYKLPISDLLFFIFTSTAEGLITTHYDHFIHLYYESFTNGLKVFDCKLPNLTFDYFLEIIRNNACYTLFQILFMHKVIFADKENEIDLINFEIDSFSKVKVGDIYFRRLKICLLQFAKLGWLN